MKLICVLALLIVHAISQDGGDQYATLASLGFRQTTGATTIVERDGQPWCVRALVSVLSPWQSAYSLQASVL